MTRSVTRTAVFYSNDEETQELKEIFDKWCGEYPSVRKIEFKPNMDNFTIFVTYPEIIEGDYNEY